MIGSIPDGGPVIASATVFIIGIELIYFKCLNNNNNNNNLETVS